MTYGIQVMDVKGLRSGSLKAFAREIYGLGEYYTQVKLISPNLIINGNVSFDDWLNCKNLIANIGEFEIDNANKLVDCINELFYNKENISND